MAETNDKNAIRHEIAIGLAALGWTLEDSDRAFRLLDLTGLTPAQLKMGVEDTTILAAVLNFLESHEPDLIACAEAIGLAPVELVNIRITLESGHQNDMEHN